VLWCITTVHLYVFSTLSVLCDNIGVDVTRIIIIIKIITTTMFMVLSSWQSHCEDIIDLCCVIVLHQLRIQ